MVVGDLSKLSDIRAQSTIFLHINTPSNLVGLYFMKSIWAPLVAVAQMKTTLA